MIRYMLFSFNGRIGRREYWIGYGASLLIGAVWIGTGIGLLGILDGRIGVACFVIGMVLLFWTYCALHIKRAHDLGRPGWGVFFNPTWIGFAKGNEGLNQHGYPFGHPKHRLNWTGETEG